MSDDPPQQQQQQQQLGALLDLWRHTSPQGDPENISVLECISLCVLVVAYDSGTRRAREMLAILKAIFPYFLRDMLRDKKAEVKQVRETIHQLTLTMRALLSNCDELTKHYSGPTSHSANVEKSRLHSGGRSGVYSPVIEIDDDSHSRFVGSEQARKYTDREAAGGGGDDEDVEWKREVYCQPRNSLLSLTSDFLSKCSVRLQEINKKGSASTSADKSTAELLDNKCFMKLVDVAQSLLKMAPYDLECIRLEGLQKYMNQVFPLTDWSLETMRPSLMTIIRRLDKLFAKIQKSAKVYHSVDWKAAATLLRGVYRTIWRHPYIVNVPNLKSLIGTCQCLVVGEDSLTSLTDTHHHSRDGNKRPELPPESFCTVVFRLISLQVLILGNAYTLEKSLHLSDHPAGGASRYNLLTHDKGESLLLNLLLPMCLKVGCGRKDAPKMRVNDVRFALNLLLNLLNPSYFRAAAGITGSGKGHHSSASAAAAATAAVQYNPAGNPSSKLRPTSLEIAFLGLKILIVCFEAQLHGEWFRIARTVREMGNRHVEQGGGRALWNFLDFVAMHRGALYALLLPFMHTRLQVLSDDSDAERLYQQSVRDRIGGVVIQGGRSQTLLLADLGSELGELRNNLNKRLQEAYLDVPDGHRHGRGRGSTHRTSFIEYVSEVYNQATNSRTTAAANRSDHDRSSVMADDISGNNPRMAAHNRSMVEALSIRGHSISSVGSGASGGALSRDFSVRSEMGSNRVLGGGRHHPGAVRGNKTSRVIGPISGSLEDLLSAPFAEPEPMSDSGGTDDIQARLLLGSRSPYGSRPSVTDKILRRTSYAGERTELQVIQDIRSANATSEPKLYRKNTLLTRHRVVRQTKSHSSKQSITSDPGGGGGTGNGDQQGHRTAYKTESAGLSDSSMSEHVTTPQATQASESQQSTIPKGRLQRQKAQSRKTFKFRKTRRDMKRLPLIDQEGVVQEQQEQLTEGDSSGTLTGGEASSVASQASSRKQSFTGSTLHAVGTVIRRISPARPAKTEASTSRMPPPHPSSMMMDISKDPNGGGGGNEDRVSISSTGTSSTIGYSGELDTPPLSADGRGSKTFFRDSFGENEDSCLLVLQERFLQQERMGFRQSVAPSAAAAEAERSSHHQYHHHHHHQEHIPLPQVNRRKNYIIFEQNDEDTLI